MSLINCTLHPGHLTCGAAYFVPGLPQSIILISLNGEKVGSITVPEAIRKNSTHTRLLSATNDIRIDYAEPVGNP